MQGRQARVLFSVPDIHRPAAAGPVPATVEHCPEGKGPMTMKLWTPKEYRKENTAVRPPQPSPDYWIPPGQSIGERNFPFASKASARGFVIAYGRRIPFESDHECGFILAYLAQRATKTVIEQAPRFEYVDDDGVCHEHIFDLLVILHSGKRIAIDVKPHKLLTSSNLKAVHKLIAGQMSPDIADELLIVTLKRLSRANKYNYELYYAVHRQKWPEDDAVVAALIRKLKGPTPIEKIVKASKLDGYGFNAVVRAIAAGQLDLIKPHDVLITHEAMVVRPQVVG
jgi:hypothetical protein